jgi:hypothetical protein
MMRGSGRLVAMHPVIQLYSGGRPKPTAGPTDAQSDEPTMSGDSKRHDITVFGFIISSSREMIQGLLGFRNGGGAPNLRALNTGHFS